MFELAEAAPEIPTLTTAADTPEAGTTETSAAPKLDEPRHLYVMTNPAMPGIVKIGASADLKRQLRSLNRADIPLKFECRESIETPRAAELAATIHDFLSDCRVDGGRDFFRITPEKTSLLFRMLEIAATMDDEVETRTDEPHAAAALIDPDHCGETDSTDAVPGDGNEEVDQVTSEADPETEECRVRLIASIESIEGVTLTRRTKAGTAYLDHEKKVAVIALPSKRHPGTEFWYTITHAKPDLYSAQNYKVMFAFGMAGEENFVYVPYQAMQQIADKLHKKNEGRACFMHIRKQADAYHIAKTRNSRKTILMATPFLQSLTR